MDTPYRPVITSQTDLLEAWRHLMTPLGFGGRSLWLMLIGEDSRPLPHLTEIADCPSPPGADPGPAAGFAELLTALLAEHAPGGRWAFLCTRPGAGGPTEDDRAWAGFLYGTCRRHQIAHDVVHLATDQAVVPMPLDDVGGYLRAS